MGKYVSERITNISELERIIQSAHLMNLSAKAQLLSGSQDNLKLAAMLDEIEKELENAMRFDFCVERRTTVDAS